MTQPDQEETTVDAELREAPVDTEPDTEPALAPMQAESDTELSAYPAAAPVHAEPANAASVLAEPAGVLPEPAGALPEPATAAAVPAEPASVLPEPASAAAALAEPARAAAPAALTGLATGTDRHAAPVATTTTQPADDVLDAVGVGIGPFNLGLAALADSAQELRIRLFDERPRFSWHAGVMVPGARLQVGFLADLVTLVDPTSRWSFLAYLSAHDRMYPFYLAERFFIPRHEYDDYCRWVSESLPHCHFGTRVDSITWDERRECFTVRVARTAQSVHAGGDSIFGDGVRATLRARNVVLGVGTHPTVPLALRHTVGPDVFHSADYLNRLPGLRGRRHITVVGSGQSGAEIFLDLLRQQADEGWALTWLTRSPAFAPLENTALALEYLTPEYVRYFHELPEQTRKTLLASQWRLHQAIDPTTSEAIFAELYEHLLDGRRPPVGLQPAVRVDSVYPAGVRGLTISGTETIEDAPFRLDTEAVVLATGYAARRPACLEPLAEHIEWDDRGRVIADLGYRAQTASTVTGGLFVQNAELHTHGAASPSLSIGAYRNATILNQIADREVFALPKRTAFTTFGQA